MLRIGLKGLAIVFLTTVLGWGCGCGKPLTGDPLRDTPLPAGELAVVNFEENHPLRYRMTSARETLIDLTGGGAERSQPQTMTERLEVVMVYTPVEVDPFGLTTITATCESAKVTRTSFTGRQAGADAIESLPQMPFTLTLTPTGRIEDRTDFERVVLELGKKAFAEAHPTSGRVKNPDMISDFVAMQMYLWDTIASVEDPSHGLAVGSNWQARQMLPWPSPVPNPPTRIAAFTLDRISEDDRHQRAHISSTYTMADEFLRDIPQIYEGSFQMRGLFGFLRRYQFQSIEGGGTQIFNMTTGVLEKDQQKYKMNVGADFALPLGDSKPVLKVDQTISIELLK